MTFALARAMLSTLCMLLLANTAFASQPTPDFTFTLPPGWHRLDPTSVPRDASAFSSDPRFAGMDPAAFLRAVKKVEAGDFDFYFRTPERGFAENIAVARQRSTVPSDLAEVEARCQSLPSMLRRRYARDVLPARCKIRRVDGRVANTIEVEGPIPGTWNLQGQIQASRGTTVSILATVWGERLSEARKEFDAILDSFRFKPDPTSPRSVTPPANEK